MPMNEPSAADLSQTTKSIPRPQRRLYAVTLAVVLVVLAVGVLLIRKYGVELARGELKQLPLPTEAVVKLAAFLQTPLGMGCAVGSFMILGLLALKGVLDGALKILIGINFVALAVFILVMVLGLFVPLMKIREQFGGGAK